MASLHGVISASSMAVKWRRTFGSTLSITSTRPYLPALVRHFARTSGARRCRRQRGRPKRSVRRAADARSTAFQRHGVPRAHIGQVVPEVAATVEPQHRNAVDQGPVGKPQIPIVGQSLAPVDSGCRAGGPERDEPLTRTDCTSPVTNPVELGPEKWNSNAVSLPSRCSDPGSAPRVESLQLTLRVLAVLLHDPATNRVVAAAERDALSQEKCRATWSAQER